MVRIPLPRVTRATDRQPEAHPFPIQIAFQAQQFIQGAVFYAAFADIATGHVVQQPGGVKLVEDIMISGGMEPKTLALNWEIVSSYKDVFTGTVFQSVVVTLNSHWDWYIRRLSEFIRFGFASGRNSSLSSADEKRLLRADRAPVLEQIEIIETTCSVSLPIAPDQREELQELSLVRNLGLHNRWEIDQIYLNKTARSNSQLGDLRMIDKTELYKWHGLLISLLNSSSIECAKKFKLAPDFGT